MSDRNALLQGVIDEPADDAVRLIFADWLDDHDEADLAEFIRAQVRQAAMNPWDAGYASLEARCFGLARAHPEWSSVPEIFLSNVDRFCGRQVSPFERGFLGRVRMDAGQFAKERSLFARHPITEVTLELHGARGPTWRKQRVLPNLRALNLISRRASGQLAEATANLDQIRQLDHFGLVASPDRTGTMAAWKLPVVTQVKSLAIESSPLTADGEAAFARATWPHLRRLSRRGGQTLEWFRAPWASTLTSLWLSDPGQELSPADRQLVPLVLPESDVQELELSWWRLEESSGRELASAIARSRVEALAVPQVRMSPAAVHSLLTPDLLSRLRSLAISAAPLTAEATGRLAGTGLRTCALSHMSFEALAGLERQPGLLELEELRLCLIHTGSDVPILANRLRAVLDAGVFPRLTSLWVYDATPEIRTRQRIGDALAQALALSPGLASVGYLRLGNTLTRAGAEALAQSPHLDQVKAIDARIYPADPVAEQLLVERFGSRLHHGINSIEF